MISFASLPPKYLLLYLKFLLSLSESSQSQRTVMFMMLKHHAHAYLCMNENAAPEQIKFVFLFVLQVARTPVLQIL